MILRRQSWTILRVEGDTVLTGGNASEFSRWNINWILWDSRNL
jgi:hypothetical protein